MTKKVILVRGVPGSGKSTHVRQIRDAHPDRLVVVCSADNFFMVRVPVVRDGVATQETKLEYIFDPLKLSQAHVYCMATFIDALNSEANVIVVDNTFVHLWEMRNYIKLANYAGCEIEIHEIGVKTIGQLRACIARNVHRVPAAVIASMALEFEESSIATVFPFES